jgi:hypothetical protein
MQFREQGRKVQCIRSTYNPTTKRSDQRVVAAFSRYVDSLPGDLPELTESERGELATWFAARQSAKEANLNSFRARHGGQSLMDMATAIEATGAALTPEQAAAIWHGMDAIRRALRKHGHRKAPPAAASRP